MPLPPLKSLLCVALLSTGALTAQAENFNPVTALTPNVALPNLFAATFGLTHLEAGAFTDTLTFTGVQSGQVSAGLLSIGFLPHHDLSFSSVTLNGQALMLDQAGPGGLKVASSPFMAFSGPITLVVSGVAGPSFTTGSSVAATYAGMLNVSNVPEPESAALLLAGLGVLGFLSRRRLGT
jgi:PEP-CTERM motif